jgi:hypothetical protein
MARRPRPAVSTSTLTPNPDAGTGDEGDEGAEQPAHDETSATLAALADIAEQGSAALDAAGRQLPVPGTESAPMQSHPPTDDPPRRRRQSAPRAPNRAAAVEQPAASSVELTDEELMSLGSLTRLAMRLRATPEDLVPLLEGMLAAYRKAQL